MYRSCQLTIFHNVNLLLPEMLYCISGIVGLQLNILLMCIKSVGRIAYYHRGHIALKHGSDWNIPMSEFHLATLLHGVYSRVDAFVSCEAESSKDRIDVSARFL